MADVTQRRARKWGCRDPDRAGRVSRGGGAERGSATVVAIGVIAVMVVLATGVLTFARAVALAHRAQAAADLAALSAASSLTPGLTPSPGSGCDRARDIAQANDATIVGCSVTADGYAVVRARVSDPGPWQWTSEASARAGPSLTPGQRVPDG